MRNLFVALRFLTILPLPVPKDENPQELAGSLYFFPFTGLFIGGLAAALAMGLSMVLPPLPVAILLVVGLVLISGGLHLDGLGDSADGLLSSRPPVRILEIMRDSRIGPMGVMAVVSVLLIKFTCLASLKMPQLWHTVFLMPLAGRCALVTNIACFPYARPEGGLGKVFYAGGRKGSALLALCVLGLMGWLVARAGGLVAVATSLLGALVVGAYTHRKIGGSTGDTLGAGCEIAETLAALVLVAWSHV